MALLSKIRAFWVLSLLVGGLVFAAFIFVFSPYIALDVPFESRPAQPLICYVGALDSSTQSTLCEQSLILAPDPLFLPTAYNYGSRSAAFLLGEPLSFGDVLSLGPELLLGEVDFITEYQGGGYYAPRSVDLVSVDFGGLLSGLGRECLVSGESVERAGIFRLYRRGDLELVQDLPASMDEVLDATLWVPVSFQVQVLNASWVGEAFMVNSSGSEQVDKVLRGFVRRLDLVVGLPDGYYRLEISP